MSADTSPAMDQLKVSLQQITGSLHSVHGILKTILERVLDDRIDEHLYLDPNDGLEYLALKAHNIHELAKEVEYKLSGLMVTQRKEKSGIESEVSSLTKENQDIHNMLRIAITEKEAAENSIRILKGNREQRKGGILQIAEKGLQKVGFGFIMEMISGEPVSEELSTSSATATSNGRGNEKEDISLVTLLREELGRVKADLGMAKSKLQLKEKLAASAMVAQAAADACLKLADSRSAGLQQRIEELTRQIEQEDNPGRKERESARKRFRYVCWPWQRLRVISASSRARMWFVDQNGRLLPRTEELLQTRI